MPTVRIHTPRCPHCKKPGVVEVPVEEALLYDDGALAQHAFRTQSAGVREQIMSGIHPECWEPYLGPEE